MTVIGKGERRRSGSLRVRAALVLAAASLATACQSPPAKDKLWISDETGNAIVVVDRETWKVEQRIPVGKRPRGIAVSPDGKRVFAALSGSEIGGPNIDESKLPPPDRSKDGVAILDAASGRIERVLKVGNDPETFALSKDGRELYVANEDSALLSIVDVQSGRIKRQVKVGGEPEGVAVSGDGAIVFLACEEDDSVYAIRPATGQIAAVIPVPGRPRTLLTSRDGTKIYVAIEIAGDVGVLDVASLKLTGRTPLRAASPEARPMGLAERADGELLISTGRGREVVRFDPRAGRVVATIQDVGERPWGIALSADGQALYTANGQSEDVAEVDLKGNRVARRLKVGGRPWGLVVVRGR